MSKQGLWVLVGWLGFAGGLSACGSEDKPTSEEKTRDTRVWIGDVAESDAKVGVAIAGEHIELFSCGGPTSLPTLTAWMAGVQPVTREAPLSDGEISIGFDTLEDALAGEVENSDAVHLFMAHPVAAGTLAGLYEASSEDIEGARLGLIVEQAPGGEPSGQGALIRGLGPARIFEQVNPVFPTRVGDPVFVTLRSDPERLIPVRRVTPGG